MQASVPGPVAKPQKKAALKRLCDERAVRTVFQPVIRTRSGEIAGYEALSRPAADSPFADPDELFSSAAKYGLLAPLERMCCEQAIAGFIRLGLKGKLLLNMSPASIVGAHALSPSGLDYLRRSGLADRVVIELTEQRKHPDIEHLRRALDALRSAGLGIAIDDLGQGFASLWLWSELHPEIVKLDRHFVDGAHRDPIKFQFLKSVQQIADSCGTRLIAEGVEDPADLLVLRDLNVAYAQGYLIARPDAAPAVSIPEEIAVIIRSGSISVFPEFSRLPANRPVTVEKFLAAIEPVSPRTTNNEVFERFDAEPHLHALPVVEGEIPRGLIHRYRFLSRYTHLYSRELYGRRACEMFMDASPLLVERTRSIHDVCDTLSRADPRYLSEGFIVTDGGNYRGVASGQDMMREITALQLEAARYANPLTMMPGNVPINEHMDRLLTARESFAAAYCDLNHFKAFNDAYGYRRGDDMIRLAARTLAAACDPRRDFAGHIGGDDFILLFQSGDWKSRCERALRTFAAESKFLFDEADYVRGALTGEDRAGNRLTFPLVSLAIGVLPVDPDHRHASHLEIAEVLAAVGKQAKRLGGNALFIERRGLRPERTDETARSVS